MNVAGVSQWGRLGVLFMLLIFFLSLFTEHEAFARRRGRGVRRGAAARVSARRGRRGGRRRGRRGRRNRRNVAPAAGAAQQAQGGGRRGRGRKLQRLDDTDRFAVDELTGEVVELNPGAVVGGQIVDPDNAVRQRVIRGQNGAIIAGEEGFLLDESLSQARGLNGQDPTGGGVDRQSFSLRPRSE